PRHHSSLTQRAQTLLRPFSLSSYLCSIEGVCRQSNACATALSRSRILEISLAVSVFGFRGGASGEERHDIGVQIIRDMRAVMSAVVARPFHGRMPVVLPQFGIEGSVFLSLHDGAETNASGGSAP